MVDRIRNGFGIHRFKDRVMTVAILGALVAPIFIARVL